MKRSFTLLSFLLAGILVFGQSMVPNNGFETWTNVGAANEEPTNWNSTRTGGGNAGFAPQNCFREGSEIHGGTYSAKLETQDFFGTGVNGTITTGKMEAPSFDPNDGYIHTVRSDADFNTPFSDRPDSLVFWTKYTPANNDTAKAEFILHGDFDVRTPIDGASQPYVIGIATWLGLPTANYTSWTRISVPFIYNNADTVHYLLATFSSSHSAGGAQALSLMYVDDVSLIYNPITALEEELEAQANAWFNQDVFALDLRKAHLSAPATFELLNMNGQVVLQREIVGNTIHEFSQNLPTGIYSFRVMNDKQVLTGRSMKLH